MRKFLKILLYVFIAFVVISMGGYMYLFFAYPKVSDATELKIDATPERIERGRYLAYGFAGCIDCHSDRDWTLFSGPVIPGTEGKGGSDHGEGAGTVPASNITSDTETGIGSWTDGELFRAITSGVDKDGKFLAPMMPYVEYAKMDKEDVYAIIAYIRTLPAIKNQVPPRKLNFPLHLIFRTIPSDANRFTAIPDPGNTVKLGEYYGISCKFCHSPNEKGEFIPGKLFSGGVEYPMPDGKIIRSTNITPDKETGIGNWTKELFIQKFKANADLANLDLQKHGYNTPMPWNLFGTVLTDEDLGAVYDYIMTQEPVKNKVEKIGLQGMH